MQGNVQFSPQFCAHGIISSGSLANCSFNFSFKWTSKTLIERWKYFASRLEISIADLNGFKGPFCRLWGGFYRRLTRFARFEDSINSFAHALYSLHVFYAWWIESSIKSTCNGFLLEMLRSLRVYILKQSRLIAAEYSPRFHKMVVNYLKLSEVWMLWALLGTDDFFFGVRCTTET